MASILERNGKYFIMVSTGYDTTGKQIRKTMTWKPEPGMSDKQIQKAVNEQAVLFEKKVLSGEILDDKISFSDFGRKWLTEYGDKQLAPKTLSRYWSLFRRIEPVIGHIRLDRLQPHHLLAFYDQLGENVESVNASFLATEKLVYVFRKRDITKKAISQGSGISINTIYNIFKGRPVTEESAQKVSLFFSLPFSAAFTCAKETRPLSNKTIRHHHRLISVMLNTAVQWQLIMNNPAQRVKAPKVQNKEAKYLDEKQSAKLISLLEKAPVQNRMMIMLLLYSGLRRGELLGLEWKDLDFGKNLISIKRTSQYLPGNGIFTKETKTESSVRTIKLPEQVFLLLKEYKRWQAEKQIHMGDRWTQSDRLFTTDEGKPVHPDSISGWFRKFIAKTDLPQISIHSLRHTNITLLLSAGVPLRTVSYRAGHAQTTTTANIYAHAIQSADEMAAQALDNLLLPLSGMVK